MDLAQRCGLGDANLSGLGYGSSQESFDAEDEKCASK
jgi:hypothetical protein